MAKFKVYMKERGRDGVVRELEQIAICETRKQVVEFYGLNEPDIISYRIEVVE